jgi:hypothetical protein
MDASTFSDAQLLEELRSAQEAIIKDSDAERRRDDWQRVIDATRELEKRYPPAVEALS